MVRMNILELFWSFGCDDMYMHDQLLTNAAAVDVVVGCGRTRPTSVCSKLIYYKLLGVSTSMEDMSQK